MKKFKLSVQCLAAFILPLMSHATEADYAEAKIFVDSVYVQKGAALEESPHFRILRFLSIDNCKANYESYTNSYSHIHFRAAGSSGGGYSFDEHSNIQFERDSDNRIIKLTFSSIEPYDCEEEGCSEEGPVVHTFSADLISSQTYDQNSDYGYDLVTKFCKI
jgi:hypothetical protein